MFPKSPTSEKPQTPGVLLQQHPGVVKTRVLLALCSPAEGVQTLSVRRRAAQLMSVCRAWRDTLRQVAREWRKRAEQQTIVRALVATTPSQLASLAEQSRRVKHAKYESVTVERRLEYFDVSCRPITKKAEDDMEVLSDLVTWGEQFLHFWGDGLYRCARCGRALYSSRDKWSGPCAWPSWRRALSSDAVSTAPIISYNEYTCAVREVYCGRCDLFIGHQFEDARDKGDASPDARWRH